MSRIQGPQVTVGPRNDILTALLAGACVAVIIALVVVFIRANTLFGGLI
jgi:hypothetical protein